MSYVFAMPEWVAAAASDLSSIGNSINGASAAAAAPTSGVLAAGGDEISGAIAALFDLHAQAYQAASAQMALFHEQFVQLMAGGAAQYASAEASNAALGAAEISPTSATGPLQTAEQQISHGITAPITGHPPLAGSFGRAAAAEAAGRGGGVGVTTQGGGSAGLAGNGASRGMVGLGNGGTVEGGNALKGAALEAPTAAPATPPAPATPVAPRPSRPAAPQAPPSPPRQ
ncbi:PE family protein [Mycobacterium vicinigordonae]|uniref:PE family protein n=1 Tax=Mycobacterium vicinigordonae TaxID=1719132 RepID=A0A7D6I4F1_9MYCO|nr:PE family protein [Mycobacterium vicinigordonae]QLL06638.1 PE family protein [Mycobacterium vicinigordonae]